MHNDIFSFADLQVDFEHGRVMRAGQNIELTPKEFALLSLLAKRPGEVLSRSEIATHVWDTTIDSETNLIDVHIARLRAKVDGPFGRKLISTIRGLGYVLLDAR